MRKKIISFNFNSWKPVAENISYREKIKQFAVYVRNKYGDAAIIAMQEFITGGGKYIDELYQAFNKDYYVVTPPLFDYRDHPKSLVSITLLRKSVVNRYEVKNLGKCLPNRVSYVIAWMDGKPWSIMNIYAVQIANFTGKADSYIADRKDSHKKLWDEIIAEAKIQSNGRVIVLGDFQESSEESHVKELYNVGYREVNKGFPTIRNDFFTERNIDHILFSNAAWDDFNPVGFALDGDLIDELSDHCLLAVMSA